MIQIRENFPYIKSLQRNLESKGKYIKLIVDDYVSQMSVVHRNTSVNFLKIITWIYLFWKILNKFEIISFETLKLHFIPRGH